MLIIPRGAAWPLAMALMALAAGSIHAQSRVVVISDLNGSYGSTDYDPAIDRAMARIVELEPDLVLSTGDMVAGLRPNPRLTESEIGSMWESFHRTVSDPLERANIPFAVTPGNHDGSAYKGYQLERDRFSREWTDRKPDVRFLDDTHYPRYYSFAVGSIAFISLDATTVGPLSTDQRTWLAKQGRRIADYPVRVVFSHLPLLPFAVGRESEVLGDSELEAVLGELEIDVYLSGHHHAYYPGFRDGVHFVSQGALGSGPRSLIGDRVKSERSFTVIDVDRDGSISIEAYGGPRFTDAIARETLPASIASPYGRILRDDLVGAWTRTVVADEEGRATARHGSPDRSDNRWPRYR